LTFWLAKCKSCRAQGLRGLSCAVWPQAGCSHSHHEKPSEIKVGQVLVWRLENPWQKKTIDEKRFTFNIFQHGLETVLGLSAAFSATSKVDPQIDHPIIREN
jgi:hypothetical protein